MQRVPVLAIALLLLAGCSSEEKREVPRPQEDEASQPAPPPDAGTQAGHGADARQVVVPRRDSSPPSATIVLESASGSPLAEASQPGEHPKAAVELPEPRLQGTGVGRDTNGGVARVRVSIKELITCRTQNGDSSFERPRTRYFPPPQIERVRSNPGTRLATEKSRTLPLALGGRCGGAEAVAVEGELWAEATNGSGLEAVTPHLRFRWKR
jgi:hypothetical protein